MVDREVVGGRGSPGSTVTGSTRCFHGRDHLDGLIVRRRRLAPPPDCVYQQ